MSMQDLAFPPTAKEQIAAFSRARTPAKRSKYGNKKTVVDGITFDSKREAKRYGELKMFERAGQIANLALQPSFELIPAQRRDDGKTELACRYVADFSYVDLKTRQKVVEDVKGVRTPDYIIKRKLLLMQRGITVREI